MWWPFKKKQQTAKTFVINNIQETRYMSTPTFTFKTREEYLEYKAQWKERYFGTIKKIREAALAKRTAFREFSRNTDEQYSKTWMAALRPAHDAFYAHNRLKAEATNLLSERTYSKIEAGRQREKKLTQAA